MSRVLVKGSVGKFPRDLHPALRGALTIILREAHRREDPEDPALYRLLLNLHLDLEQQGPFYLARRVTDITYFHP